MAILIRGGTVHLRNPGEWNAEAAMKTIEEFGIRSFVGVAAMFVDMVNDDSFSDYNLTSLDTINEGGRRCPSPSKSDSRRRRGRDDEGYGLTETTAATHTSVGSTFGPKPGRSANPFESPTAKSSAPTARNSRPARTANCSSAARK